MIHNIFKGWITTILGIIAMCGAGYGLWIDNLTDWQAASLGLVGIVLLLMPDRIPTYVHAILTAIYEKFTGKKP